MSSAIRNRVIFLALILLISQLTLVAHAAVHDAEINCQLCLKQSQFYNGIPVVVLEIPEISNQKEDFSYINSNILKSSNPKNYFQRAPPFFS